MKRDSYITKYTCAFLLLVAGLPCLQARDECYKTETYVYYCDDGYQCCHANTECCSITTSSSSSSSSTPLIAGVAVGGVLGVAVLITVVRIICNRRNSNKTAKTGQVIATVDHQQQPQQQSAYYTAYPSGSYPSTIMTDPPMYTPAPDHVAALANPPANSK